MAEWLRALIFHFCTYPFDHLTAVSGVGSSPVSNTSQVLIAGVPGALPFSPHLLIGPSHIS